MVATNKPSPSFPSYTWERTCGGNFIADPNPLNQWKSARNQISRMQKTLPSETWERGKITRGSTAPRVVHAFDITFRLAPAQDDGLKNQRK
jgi:hypothetical protein